MKGRQMAHAHMGHGTLQAKNKSRSYVGSPEATQQQIHEKKIIFYPAQPNSLTFFNQYPHWTSGICAM